jgi:hypothetical protein
VSGFADYERYDALGLADLVRRKDVSPAELLDAAIGRVAARTPAVPGAPIRGAHVPPGSAWQALTLLGGSVRMQRPGIPLGGDR